MLKRTRVLWHLPAILVAALALALPPAGRAAPETAGDDHKALLDSGARRSLTVTAFAYTADEDQTDGSEDIGAWGDELDEDVPSIAVSRDLLEMGLKRGTRVRIRGLPGEFVVLDLMHPRWHHSIDIFMDKKRAARKWGRRKVEISWEAPAPQAAP